MIWHRATILSRKQLSPTVTGLTLQLERIISGGDFSFLPGQWLDFRPLPSSTWKPPPPDGGGGGRTVGGYSITSTPASLPRLELAVQSSTHPVADWVASRALPNDAVDVRVGGTFTYESDGGFRDSVINNAHHREGEAPAVRMNNRLLFIAGGVGVNPLFSMIRQWHADQQTERDNDGGRRSSSRAVLLYSGQSMEELLFLDELDELAGETPDRFRVVCTTTQKQPRRRRASFDEPNNGFRGNAGGGVVETGGSSNIILEEGRIDRALIKGAVKWLNECDNHASSDEMQLQEGGDEMVADSVFVCGPPGMPESIVNILSKEKIVQSTKSVHFEKWW